jgi:hypothetical protein
VFQRRRPKPATADASQSCFFRQENSGFLKTRKKTSGTLYSVFKEPDPGFETHPRTTPFSRRPRIESSAKRRTISIAESDPLRQRFCSHEANSIARGGAFRKNRKPLRGREI